MSQFGNGIGNVHSDVLQANPTDQESKNRLIEEIKNRAKGSLTAHNYLEAVALYSKAIEVKSDDAILYANRSMCQLSMSKVSEALDDAEKAIEYDPTYVKGYYRKGMALVSLKKYSTARDVLQKGLDLAPGDKSFITQLDKLRGDAYQQDGAATSTSTKSSGSTPLPKTSAKATSASTTKKETTTKQNDNNSNSNDSDPDGSKKKKVDTSLRGYKTTSDGRKTTFFNNELDEHTKALIGDIAPKPITEPQMIQENTEVKGSVWNTAGTFESVTHTPWAVDRLSSLLNGVSLIIPEGEGGGGGTITLQQASLTGDAQVTVNRGKRKHIYDFSATVDWELEMDGDADGLKGSFSIEDVSGDREYEITTQVKKSSRHTVTNHVFNKYIKASSSKGNLQHAVVQALDKFYNEFQQK